MGPLQRRRSSLSWEYQCVVERISYLGPVERDAATRLFLDEQHHILKIPNFVSSIAR